MSSNSPVRRGVSVTSLIAITMVALGSCAGPAARPARQPSVSASHSSAAVASSQSPTTDTPPVGTARPVSLPEINHSVLPNGLVLWHIPSRSLPVVQVRFVVRAGMNLDRDRPGLAQLTALALARAPSPPPPGAPAPPPLSVPRPSVRTSLASTTFSLDLPKDQLEEGLDSLAALARQPRLDSAPLADLRSAEQQRVAALLLSDPQTVARAAVTHELTGLSVFPSPAQLSKVSVNDCKAFHKAAYGPKAAGLVVVGDVTFDEAAQAARRSFGSWEATSTPAALIAPTSIQYTKVLLIDRPSSTESQVVVATSGAGADSSWPALWLAREAAAQETRRVGARLCPPTDASAVLSLQDARQTTAFELCVSATVQQTAERVSQMLERLRQISETRLSTAAVAAARDSFNETLATRLDSLAALADLAAGAMGAGLDHDQINRLNTQLQSVTPEQVQETASTRAQGGRVVVVVGEAARLADELSRFGDVTVVDPAEGFAPKRQIPASPSGPAPKP